MIFAWQSFCIECITFSKYRIDDYKNKLSLIAIRRMSTLDYFLDFFVPSKASNQIRMRNRIELDLANECGCACVCVCVWSDGWRRRRHIVSSTSNVTLICFAFCVPTDWTTVVGGGEASLSRYHISNLHDQQEKSSTEFLEFYFLRLHRLLLPSPSHWSKNDVLAATAFRFKNKRRQIASEKHS